MLYIIGITGNDLLRNKRMAQYIQTSLDRTYKELYKTPNYRKYLNVVIDTFQTALDSTVMKIHELSFNRKININKQTLHKEMKLLGDSKLWDNIMVAKLEEYKDLAKKKLHFDFYVIIPDVVTESQLNILREYESTILFNFETEVPVTKYDFFAYKTLNFKRKLVDQYNFLEHLYQPGNIWFMNNKPEHYLKTWCDEIVTTLNKKNVFNGHIG